MELITRSHLRAKKNTFVQTRRFGALNEAVNESKRRGSTATEVTVFLSHKHDDREVLEEAIAFLKSISVNVYVDWMDGGMPLRTSGHTATRLKEKIRSCHKFILLATEKAINSKWCNWELGLGDAHKYIQNIALLVVRDDDTAFSGSEYLEIYPTIGRKYSFSDQDYVVQFPDGSKIDIEQWLRRK